MEKEVLKVDILNFEKGKDDTNVGQSLEIQAQLEKLRSEVKAWKQRYLIFAPISGQVSLAKIWTAQQFLKAEEELMAIIPG